MAGVTRLSVGLQVTQIAVVSTVCGEILICALQALVDEDLRLMNRDHSVEEAMRYTVYHNTMYQTLAFLYSETSL